MFEDWLLDLTYLEDGVVSFIPYEDEELYTGMVMVSDRCPGNLLGVCHIDGRQVAEAWVNVHPDWQIQYGKEEQGERERVLNNGGDLSRKM